MFSNRLDWSARPNRIAEAVARRKSLRLPLLDLTGSNPTAAGFDYPGEEILSAFQEPGALRYEPSPAGNASCRESVSEYYAARGWSVEPDNVVITASTSEAYSYLFKLLADPGDEVLAPRPSYPLFDFLARLESVRIAHYPLLYDHGWTLDFHALETATGSRSRALVIVNPNNPTGSYIKRREFEQIVDFSAGRGLAVISDEVFADFRLEADSECVGSLCQAGRGLVFSLSGLSKICGLPQMKLGWIVIGGERGAVSEARERIEWVADTYLSVGAPVQHALPALLRAGGAVQRQIHGRALRNLEYVREATTGSACRPLKAEGGWCSVIRVPRTLSEEEWVLQLLEKDGVLTQPGYFFDFEEEAYLVVSLLTPEAVFREGIQRLTGRVEASG